MYNGKPLRETGPTIMADTMQHHPGRPAIESSFGSREWFDKLFGSSPVGMTITRSRDQTIVEVNDAWLELMGFERYEVIGKTRTQLNLWVDLAERDAMAERVRQNGSLRNIEVRYRRKSGEHLVLFGGLEVIHVGGEQYVLGTAFDISDRKRNEARYQHLATHDALTDLPNRMLLRDRLGQAIRNAERHLSKIAVMFIDLDKFKQINDTLGHRAGDEFLKEVALRLTACVRDADTVARLGGDEFVVVLEGWHDLAEVASIANKICVALSHVTLPAPSLKTSASLGISVYPSDGVDPDTLMRQADSAMYAIKNSGGGKYGFVNIKATRSQTKTKSPC